MQVYLTPVMLALPKGAGCRIVAVVSQDRDDATWKRLFGHLGCLVLGHWERRAVSSCVPRAATRDGCSIRNGSKRGPSRCGGTMQDKLADLQRYKQDAR